MLNYNGGARFVPVGGVDPQTHSHHFTLVPGVTVHYPGTVALPLAIAALVLYAAVLVLGLRRRLSAPGVLTGAIGWLLSLVASLVAATLIETYLRRLNPNLHGYRVGGLYDAHLYLLAFTALSVAIAWAIPAVVGLALAAPLIYFLAVLAGRIEGIMGVPGAGLPLLFALLLIGLLAPLLDALAGRRRAWLAAGSLGRCLALLLVAGLRSTPTPAHPATNTVIYHMAAGAGEAGHATWIAVNDSRGGRGTRGQIDAWTAQFLSAFP